MAEQQNQLHRWRANYRRSRRFEGTRARLDPTLGRSSMAVPWIAVGKLVLANLDTIIGVVKPAFTRKKIETSSETDLLNQQIAELQAAASGNAEQIRQLAAQLKEVVTAVEQVAASAAAERRILRRLSLAAMAISVVSIVAVTAALFVGR